MSRSSQTKILSGFVCALLAVSLAACNRSQDNPSEIAYVTAVQASLRDRVAAVYNKTGLVNNGERVDVLEHSRNSRFVRVRNQRNEEGWLEQRYLTTEDVFNAFQKLARESKSIPVQSHAITRAELNMHLQPARDADHLYQLPSGAKLELLKRATTAKSVANPPVIASVKPGETPVVPEPVYEDWWLARDEHGRTGWLLARMVDLDVPLEVAQYAEGQRIVADFVLNTVTDSGKQVPQYLLLLNEPKDGQQQDFNQLRIFTWNSRKHHYETAYRERKLNGVLPAEVATKDFGGKEGVLPVFTVRLRDDSGQATAREYKLNGVMVHRVTAPGEASAPEKQPKAAARKRHEVRYLRHQRLSRPNPT